MRARREPGRFLHAGLFFFPSTPVTIPLWIDEAGVGKILFTLRAHSVPKAERDATVVLQPGLGEHAPVVSVVRVWDPSEQQPPPQERVTRKKDVRVRR